MAHFHHTLIRANQDVISTFVWGGVFERFPGLRLVCAEADAGWVPHFTYRLDHFYHRHRFHQKVEDMARLPSEQVNDNVYFTFQDDLVALNSLNMLNTRRLLWANDFPHSDSTWPWSQQLLANHTQHMTDEQRRRVLRDNVIELFNLPVKTAPPNVEGD
jgi:predicted TIM-barrel fold metal-dependent hydrolase